MGLEVAKKEKETPQSLIRRFSRQVQQSGILLQAKKNSFRRREKSKQMKKRAALRKEETRKKYDKLKKLGEFNA